jgi:hypothetical protein
VIFGAKCILPHSFCQDWDSSAKWHDCPAAPERGLYPEAAFILRKMELSVSAVSMSLVFACNDRDSYCK